MPSFPPSRAPSDTSGLPDSDGYKNIVILGASYGGAHAARLLTRLLEEGREKGERWVEGWRVVVIERNSHANRKPKSVSPPHPTQLNPTPKDVYVFPRFALLPQHAAKSFIPLHLLLHQPPSPSPSPSPSPAPAPSSLASLSPSKTSIDLLTPPNSLPATPTPTPKSSSLSLRHPPSPSATTHPAPAHQLIHGSLTALSPTHATIHPHIQIPYRFLIHALGSTLPEPVDCWHQEALPVLLVPGVEPPAATPAGEVGDPLRCSGLEIKDRQGERGSREAGIGWMERRCRMVKGARKVVVLGGGALGVQFATDIKSIYPEKEVTLLHSRRRLLPLYPVELHEIIITRLAELGIKVILGERATSIHPSGRVTPSGVKEMCVTTSSGQTITADLVVCPLPSLPIPLQADEGEQLPCTGQRPNTSIMSSFLPTCIDPSTQRIRIRRSMQLSLPIPTPCSSAPPDHSLSSARPSTAPESLPLQDRIFAIGDSALAFGAIQAGNAAYWQAEVAVRNVVRLMKSEEGLEEYVPNPPGIKITLGLKEYVKSGKAGTSYHTDGEEDLEAESMWFMFGSAGLVGSEE